MSTIDGKSNCKISTINRTIKVIEKYIEKYENSENLKEFFKRDELRIGSYYWVKLFTDDKYEPAIVVKIHGTNKKGFEFFGGLIINCESVTDYKELKFTELVENEE